MTSSAQNKQDKNSSSDFRLLLDRLNKATFDESGTGFVRQALSTENFLDHLSPGELVQVASVAQQHGLIEESLQLYERCVTRHPDHVDSWRAWLETLEFLGDGRAMVRVRARAASVLAEDELHSLPGTGRAGKNSPEDSDEELTAPFLAMHREEDNISLYLSLFRGRDDAFARQWVDKKENRQGYVPVKRPMQPTDVRDHLNGHRTYGIYLLDQHSMVHTGVVDADLVPRLRDAGKAATHRSSIRRETIYLHTRITEMAKEHGLCCLAEISGGKGFHFWFPVRQPVPAAAMRQALLQLVQPLAGDLECYSLEVFPKQDRLTGKGFGNLVKLPLGIHRGTGKPSWFLMAADRDQERQFEILRRLRPTSPETIMKLAGKRQEGNLVIHPRHAAWAEEYPELALLEARCAMLAQIMTVARSGRVLSLREEKILLGTLGHLPRAGRLLHHLFSGLPEYNRPLLDYKISRVRGTVLGCKRIHSLLEQGTGSLPCTFDTGGYPHPLRHLPDQENSEEPKSARTENLRDALDNLKTAIRQVERFMGK